MEADYIDNYILVRNALSEYSRDAWSFGNFPSLSLALCKLQGITSCSGTIQPRYDWKNQAYETNSLMVNGKNAGTIYKPDVDVLLAEAKPAPFGRGEETVFDESVRKGLQIPASELGIANLNSLVSYEIDYLVPNKYKFIAKLYKMHIYLPGGHFDLHRDTPHAPNHLATLVVALPSCFQGGNLTLMDYKEVKSFPLGSLPMPETPSDTETEESIKQAERLITTRNDSKETAKCHWVAFYTDVEHKVETVLSGTRIVLQFDLLAVPDTYDVYEETGIADWLAVFPERTIRKYRFGMNEKENLWTSQDRKTGAVSQDAVKDLASQIESLLREDPNRHFALVLKHRYTTKSLRPELLKSVDQLLWTELSNTFDISIIPLLIEETGDDETTNFVSIRPFDLTKTALQNDKNVKMKEKCPTYLITGSTQSEGVHMYSQSYIEHTGNEAQFAEDKYLVSCLIVHNIKECME